MIFFCSCEIFLFLNRNLITAQPMKIAAKILIYLYEIVSKIFKLT